MHSGAVGHSSPGHDVRDFLKRKAGNNLCDNSLARV